MCGSAGGGLISIQHEGGVVTNYVHMYQDGILVKEGQEVRAGEFIGKVGNSGLSTGPHLHFEVIKNGIAINPVTFMKQQGVSIGW